MNNKVLLYSTRNNNIMENNLKKNSLQLSSVIQSCLTLCNPMDYSLSGLLVHHQLLEFTQTHGH